MTDQANGKGMAIFLGSGPPGGAGAIEQYTADGKPSGKIALFGTPYGLVHRGDSLVAAVPSVRVAQGDTIVVNADGTIQRLELKQKISCPIAIALDPKSHNLLIADNEQHTVSCALAKDPGAVELLFPAPLDPGTDCLPDMSIAATRDGRVLFSSDDPRGVYRVLLRPGEVLPNPLIKENATLAADPTTKRWVALLANELKVFEGSDEQFSIAPPPDSHFWRFGLLAFAPDGTLFTIMDTGHDLEIQTLDFERRKFTPKFKVTGHEIKSIAIGPKFDWDHVDPAIQTIPPLN